MYDLQEDFYDVLSSSELSPEQIFFLTQKLLEIVVVYLTSREADMAHFMVELGIQEAEVVRLQEELLEQQRTIVNLTSMYNDALQITKEIRAREEDFKILEAANKEV